LIATTNSSSFSYSRIFTQTQAQTNYFWRVSITSGLNSVTSSTGSFSLCVPSVPIVNLLMPENSQSNVLQNAFLSWTDSDLVGSGNLVTCSLQSTYTVYLSNLYPPHTTFYVGTNKQTQLNGLPDGTYYWYVSATRGPFTGKRERKREREMVERKRKRKKERERNGREKERERERKREKRKKN